MRYLIGIDEAGRGPLAGPVSVGAMMVPGGFDFSIVAGVRDSKKLSPKAREEHYKKIFELKEAGSLDFAVEFSSPQYIDTQGIVPAINSALARCLEKLTEVGSLYTENRPLYKILLDGGLRAPEQFIDQKTIIRGDDSEPVISMASIVAKVERDRLMVQLATQHPVYGFEVHKGYGTLAHRRAIQAEGLSDLHRASFCRGLRVGSKSV